MELSEKQQIFLRQQGCAFRTVEVILISNQGNIIEN
jgi:hypothetical protein